MMDHVSLKEILPENQSAFRKDDSTISSIITLSDKVYRTFDESLLCVFVSVAMSEAFDAISHGLLLVKYKFIGFRDLSLQFLSFYLKGRAQTVNINSSVSTSQCIQSGAPQGSVLGPLLVLIYPFDVGKEVIHCRVSRYADDTQLLIDVKPDKYNEATESLNNDLRSVLEYA
nr:unnamed protein product [Callosobruchus chinensis]